MRFNNHWNMEGKHAFLGASKYHWTNYSDEKLIASFENQFAAQLGSRLHAWAAEAIRLRLRQPRNTKTLNSFINDAIGFQMEPEVVLMYSDNCFGTADAIGFRKNVLRISDLKTGTNPANMKQCQIYAAFFCLEYRVNPYDIEIILRIYQNDDILEERSDPASIKEFMDKIIHADQIVERLRAEQP